jgi:hypothetical protein
MFSCVYSISVSNDINTTQLSAFGGFESGDQALADGSVLFLMDQLVYPNTGNTVGRFETMSVDLSSIPTLKISTGNVFAFLLCSPHVSIQTRQVRATGNGILTLGKHQQSPGNIDNHQANYLLSEILTSLPHESGPTSVAVQVGTDLMAKFIFGISMPFDHKVPWTPAPPTNITSMYKQLVHSAMKTTLSGAFGEKNVSGGYTQEQMVFTSSLGHLITSAILFAFLMIALVAAQFRKGRVPFTLVNVAAALADSDVPQKSVEMAQFKAGTGESKVLKLVPGGDGRLYCVYESVD